MLTLGIETSCDDTAVAVVQDGVKVLSSLVSSQVSIHQKYGGIVPEIASRKHLETLHLLTQDATKDAGISWKDLSLVAVTNRPGLVGSLLVGVACAKAVAMILKIPLVGVNHLKGHIYANFLDHGPVPFPFLALVVSGGHSNFFLLEDHHLWRSLGETLDDAAGEAFDKVARLFGLPYPGGPVIDKLARTGNAAAINFPRPYLEPDSLNFSFSGLKTAVMNYAKQHLKRAPASIEADVRPGGVQFAPAEQELANLAASFQAAVVDVLIEKTLRAVRKTGAKRVLLAGGVACNSLLRARLQILREKHKLEIFYPSPSLCTDNAAMIASAGYFEHTRGIVHPLSLDLFPQWN